MKTQSNRKARQLGSTLLVTLIICTILCVSTMSYLLLLRQQNQLSARSQTWNLAIAYVEAGVEEGLEQLNNNYDNLATQGWTYDGKGYYVDRSLSGGGYRVYIYTTNGISNPVIIAKASVATSQFARNGSTMLFAQAGGSVAPTVVSRSVRVLCYRGGLFTKAMVAKHGIDFKGNNILTDSFDSDIAPYSFATHRAHGDVASNDTTAGAVSAGNANVYGKVSVGPGGTATWGPNVRIGDVSWGSGVQPGWITYDSNFTFPDTSLPYGSSGGIAPRSGNVVLPSITTSSTTTNSSIYPSPAPLSGVVTNVATLTTNSIPNPIPSGFTTNLQKVTASVVPIPGSYTGSITTNTYKLQGNWITDYTYYTVYYTYTTTSYQYALVSTNTVYTTNYYDNILDSGKYYATSLTGKTLVLGDAELVLPNGFTQGSSDFLTIANGASLKMYADNQISLDYTHINNMDQLAANLIIYGTANVTSVTLNGNDYFIGVLVVPNATVTLNGSGNPADPTDFMGALIASSVKLNGHFNFHYDEALGRMPANGRYLITRWDEIPNTP